MIRRSLRIKLDGLINVVIEYSKVCKNIFRKMFAFTMENYFRAGPKPKESDPATKLFLL